MKPQLYLGVDMDAPQTLALGPGEVCVFTRRRPGRESPNEDAVALIPCTEHSAVLAVADGLGGHPAGDQAAALTLTTLLDTVAAHEPEYLRDAILTGIEQANTAVLDIGQGSASTIVVAEIDHDMLRPSHAGDSMIVVCGQRGKLKHQSLSHSPVGYAEAAGLLNENEAIGHAQRHLISNMVGAADMRVEIGPPIRLAARDTAVIASDGLFDNLYLDEIIECVRAGPLDKAGAALLERCTSRMLREQEGQPHKPDDLAFILYRRRH